MNALIALKSLWHKLRQRDQFEQDLSAELEFHRQCRAEALQRDGMSPAQAQRQARLELGMLETHKDAVRGAFGLAAIDQIGLSLKRAKRALLRFRSLAVSAALILTLAMALNLSVYGIYRSYQSNIPEVMRDQPAFELSFRNQKGELLPGLEDAEFTLLSDALDRLADVVINAKQVRMAISGSSLSASSDLSTAYGLSVSGRYFADISRGSNHRPRLGRWLGEQDDLSGASNVMVLSESGWRRLTGADPAIVGKSLVFAKTSFTVVGVMPADFIDLQPFPSHFWISHSGYRAWRRGYEGSDINLGNELTLIGVPEPERTIAELGPLLKNLPGRTADEDRIARVELLPRLGLFPARDAEDVQLAAIPVLLLNVMVLLVACANLANLTLAKALGQRQEFAVHESLGASRWRIVAQLSLECALLALGCAVVALCISAALSDLLQNYAFSGLQEMGLTPFPTRFDSAVLGFALGLALLATLLVGALPAWLATRGGRNLREKSAGGVGQVLSPSRLRGSLSILQISSSFVLLFLTAIAMQIAFVSRNVELGYAQAPLLDLRHPKLSASLRAQIEQLPGVQSTTAVGSTPLYGWQPLSQFRIGTNLENAGTNQVDERFISTLGIKLLHGRNFSAVEASSKAPVVLISAAAARKFWPGSAPLGKVITHIAPDDTLRSSTVIGVLEDVVSGFTFQGKDRAMIYFPAAIGAQGVRELIVAVVPQQRAALARELSMLCARLNPEQPCDPWSFERLVERQQLPFAIAKNIALALALTALAICVFGLFGMVKFNVSNRRREMSLRLAIGAPPERMVQLMLREVMKHLIWGCAIAAPFCAFFWLAIHDSFRIGLASAMVQMFAACAVLFSAAMLAARIPANSAMTISPMESLRQL